jgi:hypothetical protein
VSIEREVDIESLFTGAKREEIKQIKYSNVPLLFVEMM